MTPYLTFDLQSNGNLRVGVTEAGRHKIEDMDRMEVPREDVWDALVNRDDEPDYCMVAPEAISALTNAPIIGYHFGQLDEKFWVFNDYQIINEFAVIERDGYVIFEAVLTEQDSPQQPMTDVEIAQRYPEHTKLKAVSEKSQWLGEFIDNMASKGIVLAEYGSDDGFGAKGLYRLNKSINDLLALHFNIDLKKIDAEKEDMLREMRELNKRPAPESAG